MGQQNSHVQHISTTSFDAVPERRVKPPRPSEPPHRPVSLKPKQPSYAVPENKVLPFALPEKRLRPVSADLSKFHPEYRDIFNSSFEDDQLIIDKLNKENEENQKWDANIPRSEKILINSIEHDHHTQVPNGDIIHLGRDKFNNIKNEEKFESLVSRERYDKPGQKEILLNTGSDHRIRQSDLRRNNTLNVDNRHRDQDTGYQHQRVNSLDRSSGRVRGHRRYPSVTTTLTSPENTILEDPSENLDNSRRGDPSMSYSGISLPKQNTFDMDYKYQLTYTQLAEHRRAKHLAEIERKTGKKLQDLSADLAENTDWGKPIASTTIKRHHSASIKSGLTDGMSFDSTLEKKKKARAPPPPRQQSASPPRERSALHLQKQNSAPVPPKRYNRLSSPHRYPAADYDMDTAAPKGASNSNSLQRSNSQREADAIGRIDSILNAAPSQLSKNAKRAENGKEKSLQEKAGEKQDSIPVPPPLPSAEQLNNSQKSSSGKEKDEKDSIEQVNLNETNKKDQSSETKADDNSPSKPVNNLRRMSSLLKHDIISTAQARTTILDKKTTPVPEKPKDPHQIFREQLEKACNKRGARLKDSNIDDMIPSMKKTQMTNKSNIGEKDTSQVSSVNIKQADKSKSKFSDDWAPEDDLSSDEDMNVLTPKKAGASEGFKSNIIPTKIKEMKGSKRYIRKQQSLDIDEKNKQGSLRKFKKSVRRGVSNAFGSFSKASGKMLRKSKPEETLPPDTQKNWGLRVNESFTSNESNAAVRREKYSKSRTSRQMVDDESELSSDEEIQNLHTNSVDHKNSFDADVETDAKEVTKTPHKMKRAGVAYIGKNGQILVLPEYETIQVDESGKQVDDEVLEGRAPKIHNRRKKKFTFETQAKKKEREKIEEQLSEQIREKEVQIEDERHKQLEMELEFRRLRELENKEKFQRYQTAQMQQQLTAALHQQHSLSALTAPQLPSPTGLPTNFGLDYGQNIQFSPLIGQHTVGGNIGLGVLNPSLPNGHVYNNSSMLSSIPYNSFPDYSKLLNQQLKTSPQQYAFLLSNISLSSNPFDGQNYPYSFSQSDPDINALFSGNKYNSFDKKEDILEKIIKSKLPVDVLSTTVESNPVKDEDKSSETTNLTPSAKDISDNIRDNPLYWSSDEEKDHLEGRTVVRSNKSGIVKIQVSDHGDATITDMKANRKSIDNASTTSSSSQSSPQCHAKIYGPLGFKPVSFDPMKKQRPVFEQEESNDSGISER